MDDPSAAIDRVQYVNKVVKVFLGQLSSAGSLMSLWDSVRTDERFSAIERQIEEQREDFHLLLFQFLKLAEKYDLAPKPQLREFEGCMTIMGEISRRSKDGESRDGSLEYQECLELVKETIDSTNPEDTLERIVYELSRTELVWQDPSVNSPRGWVRVSPRDFFFCRTDAMFQSWNPELDAIDIIQSLRSEQKEQAGIEELERKFGWKPRRMNSALAFMQWKNLIENQRPGVSYTYIFSHIRLGPEATFFLDKHKTRDQDI